MVALFSKEQINGNADLSLFPDLYTTYPKTEQHHIVHDGQWQFWVYCRSVNCQTSQFNTTATFIYQFNMFFCDSFEVLQLTSK